MQRPGYLRHYGLFGQIPDLQSTASQAFRISADEARQLIRRPSQVSLSTAFRMGGREAHQLEKIKQLEAQGTGKGNSPVIQAQVREILARLPQINRINW